MVSNKTLGVIIVVTLITSLLSQFYVLNMAEDFSIKQISGNIVDTGQASIEILSTIIINVTQSSIDWADGIINSSLGGCSNNATLHTGLTIDDPAFNQNNCWTGPTESNDFLVESLSNQNITIEIQSDKNAVDMFGISGAHLQFASFNASTSGNSCNGAYITSWTEVNKAGFQNLCNNSADKMVPGAIIAVPIKIVMPTATPPGVHTAGFTFKGS